MVRIKKFRYPFIESVRTSEYQGTISGVSYQDIRDLVGVVVAVILSLLLSLGIIFHWPLAVVLANLFGLFVVGVVFAAFRVLAHPDRVRADEATRVLGIARDTLPFLRLGLTPETADAVAHIILDGLERVIAVGVTDTTMVIGYAGAGIDHHGAPRTIVTRSTERALKEGRMLVLSTPDEVGCDDPNCPLMAGIVVPLRIGGKIIGSLKYYYAQEIFLSEAELAAAEGLTRLLSTQLELHQLERQASLATKMELKALQAQINPHFLFNTLNTIAALTRTDPEKARNLLRQFAALYRHTLETADAPITLGLELEYLEQYFAIEQARFGDRVELITDVDEQSRKIPMPSFMLQPLLENSISHGMREDGSRLQVRVSAECGGQYCEVRVADNGRGMSVNRLEEVTQHPAAAEGLGIALQNVRSRTRGFYGEDALFSIESQPEVGTTISFRIPVEFE
ncbi:MAG: histidine kinase [Coriobacteriia bacterium]|nr:histidine kinase [Coriobacteriia bacterium]